MKRDILVMRDVVVKLTQLLAGMGLRVTQQGAQAFVQTDTKTLKPIRVNIPNIPDDASEDLLLAIQGFIDHEVAHIFFTDWSVVVKATKQGESMRSMHNIVEDTYIERKMGEKYPGAVSNLKRLHEFFIEKITKPALANKEVKGDPKREFGVLLVPVARALAGQDIFNEFLTKNGYWKHPLVKVLMDKLDKKVVAKFPKIQSSQEAYEVAVAIKKIVDPEKPTMAAPPSPPEESEEDEETTSSTVGSGTKPHEPKEEEDEKEEPEEAPGSADADDDGDDLEEPDEEAGDSDGTASESEEEDDKGSSSESTDDDDAGAGDPKGTDDADDAGGSEAGDDGSSDDEDDDGSEDGGSSESAEEGSEEEGTSVGSSSSDAGDEDGDEDGDDASGTESSEPGDKGKKEGGKPGTGKNADMAEEEDNPFEGTEIDDAFENEISKLITNEATRQSRSSEYLVFTKDFDKIEPYQIPKRTAEDNIFRLDEDTRHMVGKMQKDIERMMASRSQVLKVPGFRSGRLNSAGLHRLMAGDDRVYRRNQQAHSKSTAVSLLVDNSGSMMGDKLRTAMQAAYALSQTLERVGITHEVIGFTTLEEDDTPGYSKSLIFSEQSRIGRKFSRVEPLYIPIYKSFEERLTPTVKARIAYVGNEMIWSKSFTRNNIDGESIQVATHRLLKRREERRVLIVLSDGHPAAEGVDKDLYANVHRAIDDAQKARIELVGIGIQSTAVKSFYPKHVVLNNLNDLPGQVMSELRNILVAS